MRDAVNLSGSMQRDAHHLCPAQPSNRRSDVHASLAAGPTSTCTQPGAGTATPRNPSERITLGSTTDASATVTRSRLAAASTVCTLARPPSAFRRLTTSGATASERDTPELAKPDVERNAALMSPATWSAFVPTTTCSALLDGRTTPRTPNCFKAPTSTVV